MKHSAVALALALVLLGPAGARAQLPADASWQTIESANFRVTYERGLEQLARRAAASAERGHAALSVLLADAPRGTIDIVVADNVDFSNGFAMPFPANRIVIYAKPPVDVLELQYTEDWIDMVVLHELAHVFHFDVAGGVGRALRAVFGRVPFSWPFFPVVGTPTWGIEGLAVGIESTLTDAGRIHGSYHEMVVRTAVLAGRMDDIDRLGAVTPLWPGGGRVYIYGSLFMDYLTRRYGADAAARIVRSTAGAIIPPPLWFGDVGRRALGVTFRTAYEEWQRELHARYAPLAAELEAAGLTRGEPLTDHGAFALYPRFSPDGAAIAYAANDWRSTPRVRVIAAATGEPRWSRRSNGLAALAWLPDGGVVTSDLEFVDRFRIHSDLYVHGGRAGGRMTHDARLQDPDASRDGRRLVAIENRDGTNRIVLVDAATGARRAVTPFDEHVHWALPRFSPDGARIAAGRWRTGGDYQIVVLDTLGRTLIDVTRSPGVSAAPAWSPDGHWLLFWSDRTGIPNIYAAEIGRMGGDAAGGAAIEPAPLTPRLRQVTSVLSGAYFPDVSPDGRWIVFSAYRHDGFRLERIPFDTAHWREPMPEHFTELAEGRGSHDDAPRDDALARAVRDAVADADTTAGPPGRYQPARHMRPHMWMPLLESGGFRNDFVGFWTYGADLVDRHRWNVAASMDIRSAQTQGRARYTYAGLPAAAVLGMHPTLSLTADRQWSLAAADTVEQRFVDEREDRVELGVGLTRARFRVRSGVTFAGELVRRERELHGFPAGASLRDPDDDMVGVRASAALSTFVLPPFAISRENGVTLQLAGRQRWDRNPRDFTDQQGTPVRIDGGYRELTTWNAGYVALPLPGFARHVLAVRGSGLYRAGPGSGLSGIGGTSGGALGIGVPGLIDDFGGSARLLPVRGFDLDSRLGTRAWTASLEYRLPLVMLASALRPLPLFVDRISGAAFLDAGHAWCDADAAARFAARFCPSTSATDPPIAAAGAELTTLISLYGAVLPLRFAAALPLQGAQQTALRAYFLISPGF